MKSKKELNKKKCNCNDDCKCGCNEGKECTCEDEKCNCNGECHCEDDCNCEGDCGCCHECGDIDDKTMLELLTCRNSELEEKYLRLQAEYLNYKTRTQNEVSRMLLYEGEDFIKEILVIKDNFERALMMNDDDLGSEVSKFLDGFKMILGNLTSLLDKFEVKEIDCLGLEFDPNVAEAVLTEHDENKPENVVLEVLTKGYKYKDKVIRHAMVKVNK